MSLRHLWQTWARLYHQRSRWIHSSPGSMWVFILRASASFEGRGRWRANMVRSESSSRTWIDPDGLCDKGCVYSPSDKTSQRVGTYLECLSFRLCAFLSALPLNGSKVEVEKQCDMGVGIMMSCQRDESMVYWGEHDAPVRGGYKRTTAKPKSPIWLAQDRTRLLGDRFELRRAVNVQKHPLLNFPRIFGEGQFLLPLSGCGFCV